MATVIRLDEQGSAPRPGTALEDPRTAHLDPVLASFVRAGRVGADVAAQAEAQAKAERAPVAAVVGRLGLVSSQDWAEAVARALRAGAGDGGRPAEGADPRRPALGPLPAPRLGAAGRGAGRAAAARHGGSRQCLRPARGHARHRARGRAGRRGARRPAAAPTPATGTPARPRCRRSSTTSATEFDVSGDADIEHLIGAAQEAPVVRLVNQLLTDAIRVQASDIHVEPGRDASARALPRARPAARGRGAAGAPRRRRDLAHQDPRQARHRRAAAAAGRPRPADAARPPDRPARRDRAVDARREHGHPYPRHERRRRRLRQPGPRPGRRAAAEAAARGALRHAARHRPDRQRQDDDALRGAAAPQHGQRQADQHRGPGRVPDRGREPDPDPARHRPRPSPACCARSSGTTRTSSWWARPATPRPPTSRSTRR